MRVLGGVAALLCVVLPSALAPLAMSTRFSGDLPPAPLEPVATSTPWYGCETWITYGGTVRRDC